MIRRLLTWFRSRPLAPVQYAQRPTFDTDPLLERRQCIARDTLIAELRVQLSDAVRRGDILTGKRLTNRLKDLEPLR